jgi:lipopolysaccharide transport system permease protein
MSGSAARSSRPVSTASSGHIDRRSPRRGHGWIENRPSTGWPGFKLPTLWAYRELAWFLAERDLRVRYKQTIFGVGWAVLQPLIAAGIFIVLLGRVDDLPSDGLPYPVFVFAGLTAWLYVSTSVTRAAESLVTDPSLVTKIYFPRLIAPLASILPSLADLGVSLLILVPFMAAYDVTPSLALAALPAAIGWLVAAALGTGLILAALNVKYRDVRRVIAFAVQVWLFASPVAFASTLASGGWKWVYALNPMVGALDTFRWATIGAPGPGPQALVSLAVTLIVLFAGIVYFHAAERRFADVI